MSERRQGSEFDEFAGEYDAVLNRGIGLSGERKEYFIERRVRFFRRCLDRAGVAANFSRVLDYGCGTGATFGRLRDVLGAREVIGVDISLEELAIARKEFPWAAAYTPGETPVDLGADAAYSNGTFHHIPPGERQGALEFIFARMRPGGIFGLWDNNPWNVGTRWVMSRISFDRNAVMMSAGEARRRVRAAGFEVLRTDYWFIFPRFLARLRGAERVVSWLPMGAQYQVLCRRPTI